MPQARLACLLLTLAPAGALALHTGVRAPLPAATRRASLRLAADEATGKEDDEAAAEGFNWPLLVAGSGTALGTGIHWPAFTLFVSQWQDIANSGVTGDEFNAPLQFWVFFAAMHPLLKPAIWIGEVLHSSPGPAIELFGGDFMPISFIVGNVAVLGLLAFNKRLSGALNVALLGLFINFVGLGLEGALDNGEYNLALNDGVKGCPTYQQVKQPSMADFDVKKYTGRWYEHAFHDYTQFSDVYDTTLDIELSADGTRWLDDFALRGPSPKAAPASWEKSPVANGAHYFLYGKLNPEEKGVLQESGFGVTFPNYIVDVQKDAETGAYTEAIQFQCLERGGVRIFEGINFLSRDATMSDAKMQAMHLRAKAAGMYEYGASPEQMHYVPHVPPGAPAIENNWQQAWRAIKVPELLALIESSTHSMFEDTSLMDK